MLVAPGDLADFKKWAIRKLEQGNQTDADADVLADYIIALVNGEGDSLASVRANLEINLADFLHKGAAEFSDEIMSVVHTGHYKSAARDLPSGPRVQFAPMATTTTTQTQAPRNETLSVRGDGLDQGQRLQGQGSGQRNGQSGNNQVPKQSRKRTRFDRDESSSKGRSPSIDRVTKFSRRGRSTGRHQRMYSPTMPRAYPDANNIVESYNPAGTTLGLTQLDYGAQDGQQDDPTQSSRPIPAYNPRSARCREFDARGFCTRGATCPYEHSMLPQRPPNPLPPTGHGAMLSESDLMQASLLSSFSPNVLANIFGAMAAAAGQHAAAGAHPGFGIDNMRGQHARGRGVRGRGFDQHSPVSSQSRRGAVVSLVPSGRGGRSSLSAVGSSRNVGNTKLVVENIPNDRFSEPAVRAYFERFGSITNVVLQAAPLDPQYGPSGGVPPKHVALLQFSEHEAARSAWESPDAVFGNRFVKVFWAKGNEPIERRHNGEALPPLQSGEENGDVKMEDGQVEDEVGVEQRIAVAQKVHEEKQRKAAEAKLKQEQIQERIKAKSAEMKKLLANIKAKEQKMGIVSEAINEKDGETADSEDEELKARLRKLEEEAQSLGIDPAAPVFEPSGFYEYGRGRGRGGGGYRGRGRASYRGAFASYGRGGAGAAPGAVMRLDNRPKKIAIVGIEAGSQNDEVLRRFLLMENRFEQHDIEPHPERSDSQVVSFAQRYMAEMFLDEAPRALGFQIRNLELKWYSGTATASSTASTPLLVERIEDAGKGGEMVVVEEGSGGGRHVEQAVLHSERDERDLDVAEDDERWMR